MRNFIKQYMVIKPDEYIYLHSGPLIHQVSTTLPHLCSRLCSHLHRWWYIHEIPCGILVNRNNYMRDSNWALDSGCFFSTSPHFPNSTRTTQFSKLQVFPTLCSLGSLGKVARGESRVRHRWRGFGKGRSCKNRSRGSRSWLCGALVPPLFSIPQKFNKYIYIYDGMHLSLPPIPILYFAKLGGRINIYNTYLTCLLADPTPNPGRSEGKRGNVYKHSYN